MIYCENSSLHLCNYRKKKVITTPYTHAKLTMSFRSGGKGLRPSDDGQFQDSAGQSAETMLLSRKVGLDEL